MQIERIFDAKRIQGELFQPIFILIFSGGENCFPICMRGWSGSSQEMINEIITRLEGEFALRKLGDLPFFLDIQAQRTPQGINSSFSTNNVLNLLEQLWMDKFKTSFNTYGGIARLIFQEGNN